MTLAMNSQSGTSNAWTLLGLAAWNRHRFLNTAVLMAGVGAGFVVGHAGSLPWQMIRVTVVAGLAWLVYVIIDRGTQGERAGVAFATGCISVAVGVGIGVPHLAKAGATPTTIAGLAVLAGGVVLLGFGAAVLVRATQRWWRALVVPALVVAIVVALWTLGQAVAATNVPRTSVGSTTPADHGLSYRDVEFQTADGVAALGLVRPVHEWRGRRVDARRRLHPLGRARPGRRRWPPTDLACCCSTPAAMAAAAAERWTSAGTATRTPQPRCHSSQAQPDVDDERIAAVGMSMGGEQAIGAAAADPRIRAVVAEGATNRVAGDKAWLSEEFGWRGAVQERIDWLTYGIADVLTAADPPITLRDAVATASPRPVLLIAGGAVENEPLAGRYIQSGSPDDRRAVDRTRHRTHRCARHTSRRVGAPGHDVPQYRAASRLGRGTWALSHLDAAARRSGDGRCW